MFFDPEQDRRDFNRFGLKYTYVETPTKEDAVYQLAVDDWNKKWHKENDKVINLWEDR